MSDFLKLFPKESIIDCKLRADRLYKKGISFSGLLSTNKDLRRICLLVEHVRELEKAVGKK